MIIKPRGAARWVALAAIAGSALLLSACGSSSGAAGGVATQASPADQACVDKANKFLADWEKFPTTLPARYTKLDKTPPTGKTIVYIRQNFPATASTFKGFTDGANALGWTAKSVIYDNTVPDFLAKLDTVIAQKPDFISWSGLPAAVAQKQIDAAKAAGINVVINSTTDAPVSSPGLAGVGNGTETSTLIADVHANKMLADSGCKGNTAIFSLDYPIIDVSDKEYEAVVKENCPDCKVSVVKIQPQDIGAPKATQQMVAKLQADPSTKYAYTVIGDLAGGLAQALKTAGLNDVKIFGEVPNDNSIADLRAGTNAWWVLQSSYVNGLDTVDMAARVSTTGEIQKDSGGYPLALLTKDNVPKGEGVPTIPSNIKELFAGLWNVGS
jgi:ABC-type sugar transport system substrate-binding protein